MCDCFDSVVMWLLGSKNFLYNMQLYAVGLSLVDSSSGHEWQIATGYFPAFDVENGVNPAPIFWQRPL